MGRILTDREQQFLIEAARYLEKPTFLMRVAEMVGQPLESMAKKVMPDQVAEYANQALRKAMDYAARTVPSDQTERDFHQSAQQAGRTGTLHKIVTGVAGAASGMFGLPAVLAELPFTTGVMFRSIASIAAQFGEDLNDPVVRLECLTVFSQGGPSPQDDAMESTYLTTRLAMTALITEASGFMVGRTAKEVAEAVARGTAPALVRFIGKVGTRFNVAVSEKLVAQSLPVIGAGTGALINVAFSEHFNSVARYHFGIRKLERQHGVEVIQERYRLEARRLKSLPG